jgi:hypothetical protein
MTQQRKQSHDNEQSRPDRIDSDAGCDLRTFICACGRIGLPGLASRDRPLGSASATCLQCFLSGNGAADSRQQQVPLSWRTEIERLMVLPANGTRKTFGSKLPPRPATSFIPHVVAGVLQRRRPAPAGQFDRVVKFAGPAFGHQPLYARIMCRNISATTATRDTSGKPALTASMIIEGRSDLNIRQPAANAAAAQADFKGYHWSKIWHRRVH